LVIVWAITLAAVLSLILGAAVAVLMRQSGNQ